MVCPAYPEIAPPVEMPAMFQEFDPRNRPAVSGLFAAPTAADLCSDPLRSGGRSPADQKPPLQETFALFPERRNSRFPYSQIDGGFGQGGSADADLIGYFNRIRLLRFHSWDGQPILWMAWVRSSLTGGNVLEFLKELG
jgi:hypothetical protein